MKFNGKYEIYNSEGQMAIIAGIVIGFILFAIAATLLAVCLFYFFCPPVYGDSLIPMRNIIGTLGQAYDRTTLIDTNEPNQDLNGN